MKKTFAISSIIVSSVIALTACSSHDNSASVTEAVTGTPKPIEVQVNVPSNTTEPSNVAEENDGSLTTTPVSEANRSGNTSTATELTSKNVPNSEPIIANKKVQEGSWVRDKGTKTGATLTVSNVNEQSFRFNIGAMMNEHNGEIDGVAQIKGDKAIYKASDIELNFQLNDGSIEVKEVLQDGENPYAGAFVTFNGSYQKQ